MNPGLESTQQAAGTGVISVIVVGVLLLTCLVLAAAATVYLTRKTDEVNKASEATRRQPLVGGGRQTATGRMQQRLRRRRQTTADAGPAEEDGSGADDEDEAADAGPANRREQRRAERHEARARQDAAQQHRQTKQQAYDARRAAKEAAREEEERKLAEEIARLNAERAATEAAEAEQWMGQISLESEGTGETDLQQESQGLLGEFVEFIKGRKTSALDDLAAQFGLRTQEVINRVQGLEAMGRLTGVMDDRGKFIYISPEEMEAVANFIKQRGRVAIAELAARSNTLIDLQSKAAQLPVNAAGGDIFAELDDETGPAGTDDAAPAVIGVVA